MNSFSSEYLWFLNHSVIDYNNAVAYFKKYPTSLTIAISKVFTDYSDLRLIETEPFPYYTIKVGMEAEYDGIGIMIESDNTTMTLLLTDDFIVDTYTNREQ